MCILLLHRGGFHRWSRFHPGIGSGSGSFDPWNCPGIGSRKIGIVTPLVRSPFPLTARSAFALNQPGSRTDVHSASYLVPAGRDFLQELSTILLIFTHLIGRTHRPANKKNKVMPKKVQKLSWVWPYLDGFWREIWVWPYLDDPNMVNLKLGRPNMVKLKFPSRTRDHAT